MKSGKEEVMELLEQLPEDTSLEDIQYHIYVRQKIQKGLDAGGKRRSLLGKKLRGAWPDGSGSNLDRASMAGPGSSCRFHRSGFGNLRRCLCLGSDRVRKIPHTIR